MTTLDVFVLVGYLAIVAAVGVAAGRGERTARGFLLADRSMPWWVVGLSVMATQASAITFIGTTGKAYEDGMRFVQFYYGLPIAMVILAFTLVPAYHRANVYTAYELLGQRFGEGIRLATSLLFLLSRGLALGVVVYAPSVVLSLLLGWSATATVLTMAAVAVAYTVIGGVRAVMWTDVLQMLLVFCGMTWCASTMLDALPDGIGIAGVLHLAELTDRLDIWDTSLDPRSRFTVWSGVVGGTFLFLSYFGCDQSQVQRFLTSRSLADSRRALAFNGLLKIPVQLGVLFVGVLLFTFHVFEPPPVLFDPSGEAAVAAAGRTGELAAITTEHDAAASARREAALALVDGRAGMDVDANAGADGGTGADAGADADAGRAGAAFLSADAAVAAARTRAVDLVHASAGDEDYNDTNHVFPRFVLHWLPAGLTGLLIAVFFAAAMSSMDSELNALSTSSVIDIWARHIRPDADEAATLRASRVATLIWGLLAAAFALYARRLGSVIEAVNQIGSWFYGSLLGVFVLAFAVPRATGAGALAGLAAGMSCVAIASAADVAWLWLNPIGCVAVVAVGWVVSVVWGKEAA